MTAADVERERRLSLWGSIQALGAENGLIYHYPRTARPAARDAAEVEATKNAASLNLPRPRTDRLPAGTQVAGNVGYVPLSRYMGSTSIGLLSATSRHATGGCWRASS